MPGTPQTLDVPPPVSVPTLLYGIYQSVQSGGGGGGGGTGTITATSSFNISGMAAGTNVTFPLPKVW